jgi:hypothetical protein
LTWSVTGDNKNVPAVSYDLLISKRNLTDVDFINLPQDVTKKNVSANGKDIGDALTESFGSLAGNTPYYVAVAGLNSAGHRSPITIVRGNTLNDQPPAKIKNLEDLYFPALGHRIAIDLSEYFTDEAGGALRYEAVVDPASAVKVEKGEDGKYTFISQQYGQAKITVTAYDLSNQPVADDFTTMCRDDSRPMDLYPNPVRDYMHIRLGANVNGSADVAMYNSSGARVLSERVNITTFEPGRVDVSRLSADLYTVVVTYNNKETKGAVTKY